MRGGARGGQHGHHECVAGTREGSRVGGDVKALREPAGVVSRPSEGGGSGQNLLLLNVDGGQLEDVSEPCSRLEPVGVPRRHPAQGGGGGSAGQPAAGGARLERVAGLGPRGEVVEADRHVAGHAGEEHSEGLHCLVGRGPRRPGAVPSAAGPQSAESELPVRAAPTRELKTLDELRGGPGGVPPVGSAELQQHAAGALNEFAHGKVNDEVVPLPGGALDSEHHSVGGPPTRPRAVGVRPVEGGGQYLPCG